MRMAIKSLLLGCLLSLVWLLPVYADEILSLKVGYQLMSAEGTFAGQKNGIGTSLDLENDFDVDNSQGLTGELAFSLGDFRLSAGYLPLDISGETDGSSFTFNGTTFTTSATGDIKADIYDVGLTWYLLNFDDLPIRVQLGPELAVKAIDADLSVKEKSGALDESVSGLVPIPTLGGRVRLALADFLGLVGRVGYMQYSGNHYTDAEVQLEFSPLPLVGLYGGYRLLDLKVDESDVLLDASFSGPFVGALVRF